jgi:hypothetical protein
MSEGGMKEGRKKKRKKGRKECFPFFKDAIIQRYSCMQRHQTVTKFLKK